MWCAMANVRQSLRRLRTQAVLGLLLEIVVLTWCVWAVTEMSGGRWIQLGFAVVGTLAAVLVGGYVKVLRKIRVLLLVAAVVDESVKEE